jgi:branched-chain amino acid transport system substrate-binding protein
MNQSPLRVFINYEENMIYERMKVFLLPNKFKYIFLSFISMLQLGASQKEFNKSELVLGIDADLTLAAATAGSSIVAGAKIAVDEINEKGGLLGRKIRIEARDHSGVSSRGIANIKELSENPNLIGVIGGIHSNVILSELDVIHKNKIPYLIPWAAAVEIVDNGYTPNFVFRLGGRDEHVGEFLVREALKRSSRVALLLENTVWGRSNQTAMMSALMRRGKKPVSVHWVDRGASDVNLQISGMALARADVVLMVLNGPESALAVRNIADRKFKIRIISHWGVTSDAFFDRVGDAMQKVPVYFFQPFSFVNNQKPVTRQVLARYHQMRGPTDLDKIPAPAGIVHSYDLTRMIAEAVKRSGVVDREKIRDAIESLPGYEGVSRVHSPPFSKNRHDALHPASYFLAKFNENGGIEPLESSVK